MANSRQLLWLVDLTLDVYVSIWSLVVTVKGKRELGRKRELERKRDRVGKGKRVGLGKGMEKVGTDKIRKVGKGKRYTQM